MFTVLLSHSAPERACDRKRHALCRDSPPPSCSDRQTELIGFTGGLAEERKLAHLAGASALHRLFHSRVRDDQFAIVENVVADQAIEKFGHSARNSGGSLCQLLQRLGQAMRDLHVAPLSA